MLPYLVVSSSARAARSSSQRLQVLEIDQLENSCYWPSRSSASLKAMLSTPSCVSFKSIRREKQQWPHLRNR